MLSLVNNKLDTAKYRGNVHHPQNVTLGRCALKFWHLFTIKEIELKPPIDTSSSSLPVNKEIQTEFKSPNSCKSCTQTTEFLKDITNYIAINFETSLTKSQRDSINDNIFNMTKLGITMKLTNCLKQDYQNLITVLKNSKHENRSLAETITDLELDISRKEQIIEQMMSEKHLYHEEMAKHLVELASAESYIITLEKEKSSLQKNKHVADDLRQQIELLQEKERDQHKNFKRQISDYEKKLDTQKCKLNSLKSDYNQLKVKFDHLYGENSKMCQMNFKLEKNMENMTSSIGIMNNIADNINRIGIHNTENITHLQDRIKALQKCIREQTNSMDEISVKHKASLDSYRKGNAIKSIEEDSKVQGNPVLDLSKQIEENEVTIDKLQLQNKKFRIIIEAYQNKT
ncbi:hypothetical protein WA026_022181 [Henosepilachna vigintioctopunctata]|uniref:Uncharacterized protein n=1 Tax=Henosepilachna vigintioctopunctata TaxID=420089 RepID=A0AAW1TXC9_9CUCU